VLDADGPQVTGRQAEQGKDRRSDLRGPHHGGDHPAVPQAAWNL